MKQKMTIHETISITSMLFGMFFGAGNLIFPVYMGQLAGQKLIPAIIGFCVTGVGLPLLAVAALGISRSSGLAELSSRVGIRGILKKLGYLVIVAVAGMLDWLIRYGAAALGWEWAPEFLVSSVVIVWLIINELLSILENVEAIGVPVPVFLRKLLGRLKVSTEAKADTEEA